MAPAAALPKNPARTGAAQTTAGATFRRHKRRVGRPSLRKTVLALASLCCTSWALAQSASDAANAERMERAKRDASNPLRMIIEASSVKRAKPADAPPAAAPAAARAPAEGTKAAAERRPAPRTEAQAPAAEPMARPVASQSPVVEAEPVGHPAPQAGVSDAPARQPPSLATVPAGPAGQEPSAAGVPAAPVPTAGVTAAPAAAAATAAVPAAALAAPAASTVPATPQPAAEVLAPLKLVRYIEPEIPVRIRGRLKPSSVVTVAFKVRPDGSVSDVGIRQTTARALDPIVLDAVRQWRYDPVPAEREHVVQLVFNLAE
jgi:protein TonB